MASQHHNYFVCTTMLVVFGVAHVHVVGGEYIEVDLASHSGSVPAAGGPSVKSDGTPGSIWDFGPLHQIFPKDSRKVTFKKTQKVAEDYANGKKRASLPHRLLYLLAQKLGTVDWRRTKYKTTTSLSHNSCMRASSVSSMFSGPREDERHRFNLLLHPTHPSNRSNDLPDVDQLWSQFFVRPSGGYVVEDRAPINTMMVTFVNWFHDDEFVTVADTNGSYHDRLEPGLRLNQVYGDTWAREKALRTFVGGRMKTTLVQRDDGAIDELPPTWREIQQDFPSLRCGPLRKVPWTP